MSLRRVVNGFLVWLVLLAACGVAKASEFHGQVVFSGLPLPGSQVTVTATQGDKKEVAISDDQGGFVFTDLSDGTWHLNIEMTGFAPLKTDITVPTVVTAADAPATAASAAAIAAAAPAAPASATATPSTPAAATTAPGTPAAAPASITATPSTPAGAATAASTAATAATPTAPAAPRIPVVVFEMKLLTLAEIRAADKPVKVDTSAPVAAPSGQPPTQVADIRARCRRLRLRRMRKAAVTKKGANPAAAAPTTAAVPPSQDSTAAQANDGFLINGSVNNAATSQFSLSQAFGNNRNGGHGLYNYSARLILDSSFLDAKSYAVAGTNVAKPSFLNLVGGVTWGGPLKIGHWLPLSRAPNFYLDYQRTQSKTDNTTSALFPTATQIGGNLSSIPSVTTIYAPTTGLQPGCTATPGAAFAGNIIPTSCISPVSKYLLQHFYPTPNVTGNAIYNYQVPLASDTHTDSYRAQLQKSIGNKNYVNGNFVFTDSRSSTPNIFGFLDTNKTLNASLNASWYHRITQRLSTNASYNFSRSHTERTPFFVANNTNVSGNAGIASGAPLNGNLQDATDYGPPQIGFTTSGFSGLSDSNSSNNRPETNSVSLQVQWNKFRHNVSLGGDFRRQEWNYFSQSNPRGSLTFTGPGGATSGGQIATGVGSDFADFLLGIPDSSQISYGNADKYLRQSVYDLYADADFRVSPELSIHGGVRWEYGAPITELKDRLVNLDIGPGFTAEAPVLASSFRASYPTSLIRPDKIGVAPTMAIAWRPISGSSVLVRAGYGIYHDTSVYQSTALAMAQQHGTALVPLSTSLSIANSAACRFTITAPFPNCGTAAADQLAVDPNFRVGYAQAWSLSVQRDLPMSLQLWVTYSGIKGTRGVQEFLPNSYAPGLTTSPYGTAPSGYYYRDSNGASSREAGTVQLRRRLRNGFQANLNYTFSKSLDDDYSLGGQGPSPVSGGSPQVAQDWTHPSAQRGLSTFDQRHVLAVQLQYTTGMGLGGHTMLSGWKGAVYKEWTVLANITAASGMPLTPIVPIEVPGTAYANIVRASYGTTTGCTPIPGRFINTCEFVAPAPGQFGNVRRDGITGPDQFTMNASMNRGFRLHDRYNLTAQLDATNVLNHVTYGSYITTLGTQFGAAPSYANSMRSVTLTFRLRY